MGVALSAGALVVGAVAEAAPNHTLPKLAPPTSAPAVGSLAWPDVPEHASTTLQQDFDSAAAEFHVPVQVLMAVSYEETLWESHGGRPSVTGNYNVMGLTQVSDRDLAKPAVRDLAGAADGAGGGTGRGTAATGHRPSSRALAELGKVDTASPALHTLQTAAALAGASAKQLRVDMRQSVRGGAALLASLESHAGSTGSTGGAATAATLPTDPAAWWQAVVAYAQAETAAAGRQFAVRVYGVIEQGASRLTDDNQQVELPAAPEVRPAQLATALDGATAPTAECPAGLACTFTPAAYRQTAKGDPNSYGNYARADRPADGDAIQYLVVHDTEGSRDGAVAFFQDPTSYASAHYVVGRDGSVTQLVATKDVAWHAGNRSVNAHSIGIEHEGFALRTGSWYTEAEYESSAALIRYLADRFNIPLDREHLIGHDDVPAPTRDKAASMHWDPGPYWDWSHLLDLVGAPLTGLRTQPVVGGTVTVAPAYDRSTQPALTGCGGAGRSCPSHPANFLYLRQAPSATAPLLGGGSTDAWDWTDKADYGQTFVVAGTSVADDGSDWVGIWYGGQEAWFEDPQWRDTLVPAASAGTTLTLVAPVGDQPIPVFGRAYPETSAYPPALAKLAASAAQQPVPLAQTISPGQAYLAGTELSGDFYAASYGCARPTGCAVVIGTTQYYPIRFNHRLAYVRASDVQLISPVALPSATASR